MPLNDIAAELEITPVQLVLAWLLHQGDDIFPIPSTRKSSRIDENVAAASIELDPATLERINAVAKLGTAEGETLL